MEFGQILQVVLSLGVVALALYLSTRLARRRLGAGSEAALRVVSRQAVSRTQNLVVVEANGHRHLLALTEGGAHTVDSWDAPEPEAAAPVNPPAHREPSPSGLTGLMGRREGAARPAAATHRGAPARRGPAAGGFAATLAALTAGTQWSSLGARTSSTGSHGATATSSAGSGRVFDANTLTKPTLDAAPATGRRAQGIRP